MTPAARVQAAIELLDEIIDAARTGGAAADTLIARYFKTRRYAGSKDRRAVRELVYRAIRRSAERPATGRSAILGLAEDQPDIRVLFDGIAHGPAPAQPGEEVSAASVVPSWLGGRLDPLVGEEEHLSLLERAPLDARVNSLRGSRDEAMRSLPEATPTPLSPLGLRFPHGYALEDSDAWQSGLVEVQDEGSQLLSLACGAKAGMTVVDLCAGAGGKTLALAAEMADKGRIVGSDTDRGRLSRLTPRLSRAGVTIVEPCLLNPGSERQALADVAGQADIVLVDAPCSGTGTWRRNPETRWRLDEKRLAHLMNLQSYLLELALELVRPGGHLIYAVCSILAEEGRNQAEAFGRRHSALVSDNLAMKGGRPAGPGVLLTPGHDGTDGFFVARWQVP